MGRFWTEPAFGGHDTGKKPAYDARVREEVRTALEKKVKTFRRRSGGLNVRAQCGRRNDEDCSRHARAVRRPDKIHD
jgi:hypothetical protein